MKVIGLTGNPGAGKDMVADYLVTRGFTKLSGGDQLREKMRKLGLPLDRTSIREFAAKMREKHGNGYLVGEMLDKIQGDTVISAFRNLAGIEIFRERFKDSFILVAVDAPIENRYQRIHGRGREGDNISLEQFREEEEMERHSQTGSHEVDKVMATADVHIMNTGTKEELFVQIDKLILNQY